MPKKDKGASAAASPAAKPAAKPKEPEKAPEPPATKEDPPAVEAKAEVVPLSEDHRARAAVVFKLLDIDKNGTLEKVELAKIAQLLFENRENKVRYLTCHC